MSNLDVAIKIATEAHLGQTRKGSMAPYIVHPIAVMRTLANIGVHDQDVLCAAVLHDVLEDTDLTVEQLRQAGFSDRCIGIVGELTKKPGQGRRDYTASFAQASEGARLVKCLDRADNLEDLCWSMGRWYAEDSANLLESIQTGGWRRFAESGPLAERMLRQAIEGHVGGGSSA